MSEELANQLDLELAWERAKADFRKRVFVREPLLIELIEVDLPGWLDSLRQEIRTDGYNPSPAIICDVPKGRGEVRPGSILSIADRVIYAACVGACLPQIRAALRWSPTPVDFSYRLSNDATGHQWFLSQFSGWDRFRTESLAMLEKGISYVLVADISGYYENIDLATLASDLRQAGAPAEPVGLLATCLNRWAQVPGRGVPQGHSPSDVLGKIYLNSVDQNLRARGYLHYRYVDDLRIFCRNRVEAKKALVDLSRLLRHRGLNLQSAKVNILRSDAAREKIEGIAPIIKSVSKRFVATILDTLGVEDPYATVWQAEQMLEANPDNAPLELIRETYRTYFIDSASDEFDSTLFRFLLNRLGRHNDAFAAKHCVEFLEKRPEVTDTILRYWHSVKAVEGVDDALIEFVHSEHALYPYQIYQILEWRHEVEIPPSDGFVAIARQFAFDQAQPRSLRSVSRRILAAFGTLADLENLQHSYANFPDPWEQTEIICALSRMEAGRRNAFISRCARDGNPQARASRLVRTGRT